MKTIILLTLFCGALSIPIENEGLQEFIKGNHLFTAAVYKELLQSQKGNFIASPFSVETILALTNEGARGDTSSELVTGLSLPNTNEKIRGVFKSFLPMLKVSDEDLRLLSANKIYVKPDVKLENAFSSVATSVYDSEVSNIDFKNKDESAATINKWVEEKTNNKIKNLLDANDIKDKTAMVLINALYFSGKWTSQFRPYRTHKAKFFKSTDDSIEVDTMYQAEYFNYYENPTANAKVLELPYVGKDNISMTIVLPNEVEGLSELEDNLEQLFTSTQPFKGAQVEVFLPKFTIETDIKFKPILQNLGIKKLFQDDADLTGLSSTDKNLLVSDVIQKAFINVTETGTEAAAASGVIVEPASVPLDPEYIFKADHPFLYFIKRNEIILFVGRHTNPSYY